MQPDSTKTGCLWILIATAAPLPPSVLLLGSGLLGLGLLDWRRKHLKG